MMSLEEIKNLLDKKYFDKLTSIDNLLYQNIILMDKLNKNIERLTEAIAGKEKLIINVAPERELFYIPKSKDWEWKPVKLENQTLKAKDRKEVWNINRSGWVWYAFLVATSPDIRFSIDIHGDSIIEIDYSIKELYQTGFGASLTGFRVLRYHDSTIDDPTPVYSVEWGVGAYNSVGVPFRGKNVFMLRNPTSSDIVYTFYAWLLLLKED